VRAISFTGSTATGNRIVKAAGLKKFSMELGGKSPFVIFDDADLDRALDAAIFMIFSNNGERCTAGSRILVQQSIYADFVEKFVDRARRITVGDPLDEKTIVGPMISAHTWPRCAATSNSAPRKAPRCCAAAWTSPATPPSCPRR
jgi:5-carboxymethyl-2-hydroxymuconic-semialdehyde dehydrogenase